MTSLLSWTAVTTISSIVLIGCGSQTLRLASPETVAGIGYTCTSGTTCYPASVAAPPEGQRDDAIILTLPRECQGRIHEIVVREPDSSSPEIDVTCARSEGAQPSQTDGVALTSQP